MPSSLQLEVHEAAVVAAAVVAAAVVAAAVVAATVHGGWKGSDTRDRKSCPILSHIVRLFPTLPVVAAPAAVVAAAAAVVAAAAAVVAAAAAVVTTLAAVVALPLSEPEPPVAVPVHVRPAMASAVMKARFAIHPHDRLPSA